MIKTRSISRREIRIKPIGIVRTPYKNFDEIPIQGVFKGDVSGEIELFPEYREGLEDLEGFSHLILIFHFHQAKRKSLKGMPYLENVPHGIFAIRSPFRPNHLGLSVVAVKKIQAGKIIFSEVDILDGTPLLDIKPYVSYFDSRENVKNGWLEKHFQSGKLLTNRQGWTEWQKR